MCEVLTVSLIGSRETRADSVVCKEPITMCNKCTCQHSSHPLFLTGPSPGCPLIKVVCLCHHAHEGRGMAKFPSK